MRRARPVASNAASANAAGHALWPEGGAADARQAWIRAYRAVRAET